MEKDDNTDLYATIDPSQLYGMFDQLLAANISEVIIPI
jgi:hypothetical protein